MELLFKRKKEMSGIDYLVDTNIFIYLLEENPIVIPFVNDEWNFSYITELELLGNNKNTKQHNKIINQLLQVCNKLNHNDVIQKEAIQLMQQQKIKIPDAIIAATSMYFNLPILTADAAFTKIKNLDVVFIEK
ncbi:MAG: PIN domain-containing protein [Chitinophagales bacterium]